MDAGKSMKLLKMAEIKRRFERGKKPKFSRMKLDPAILSILEGRGIRRLYKHQAEALRIVEKGRNVVITAPTASGKTEIFLIPIVKASFEGRRSLVIYPTKALARDQLRRFREFSILGVRSDVYDGDTPQSKRRRIRENLPHVLITNFDMLHFMLLRSNLFRRFFSALRYVVIDEIHTCSGSMASHVHNIILRLKRVVKKYGGGKLLFICSSATIGNAREFAQALCGERFSLVEAYECPRGPVKHIIINPPFLGERRASYISMSEKVLEKILKERDRILVFGNSHNVVERLGLLARRKGIRGFRVYRAGLSREMRREIERKFKEGSLRVLATTSALELGMDIGSVDAVILAGFPGTVSRVKQRIGRCGRKGQKCTAVFVARDNPLDQYYVEHPEKYLKGRPENCYVNPQNRYILKLHLLSMMRDYPATEDEISGFCRKAGALFGELKEEGLCKEWAGVWIPTKEGIRKVQEMNIRGTGESIRIYDVDEGKFIGDREKPMAIKELFPGAVYLHGGRRYVSLSLDMEEGIARVRRAEEMDEYTVALREKTAEVISRFASRKALGCHLYYGKVHITDVVYGYVRKGYLDERTVAVKELDEPLEYEFDTLAMWVDFPRKIVWDVSDFQDGIHAVEHVSIAMIPALTGADPSEIGGLSYPSGRMFIYDGTPMGSGATKVVFERFEEMERMALDRLKRCRCRNGCPSCIYDPQCGNNNRHLNKEAAKEILRMTVGV